MVFAACNPAAKYQEEIKTLNDHKTEVKTAKETFDAIDFDRFVELAGKTSSRMAEFNRRYRGDLNKEQARRLSEFNDVKRLLKGFGSQYKRLKNEFERTDLQLSRLIETIESGADKDDAGNIVDENYVTKQIELEIKVAQSLIEATKEFSDRLRRADVQFKEADQPMQDLFDELVQ